MGTPGKSGMSGIKAIALVTELGLGIAIPIVIGALAGSYLDQRYGGNGLLFILVFLLGLASGIYNGYRLLRAAVEDFK